MFGFLEQGSSNAANVDLIFAILIGISSFLIVMIAGLIIFFAIKYRAGSNANRDNPPISDWRLEATWVFVPLVVGVGVFMGAATVFLNDTRIPDDALEIYVVAKQWMWKTQHPEGRQEINELHIPVNQPIKLTMISQDVIHSFWVPDFRVKQDVLPGRYTRLWFEPIKTGEYPLRCAEYCGVDHSLMVGTIYVMEQAEYQAWLSRGTQSDNMEGNSTASGAELFTSLGCSDCHRAGSDNQAVGPALQGLFGSTVELQSGAEIIADESYIRESILDPNAKIVSGFSSIMPTFEGQVDEEEIITLINYIKSLG